MIETIYLHPNWGTIQQHKEDGESIVYHYESKSGEIIYPFIKRKAKKLNGREYYDLVTPRGESGPTIIKKNSESLIGEFDTSFQNYCDQNDIIAEYIRLDPWNSNIYEFNKYYDISNHGHVYCHRLQEDFFATQYTSKRRNQIRKAINSGVKLELDTGEENLDLFLKLYQYTVNKHDVSNYYLLDKSFLKKYFELLGGKVRLGFAYLGTEAIAGGMFLNGGDIYHYHFSASHPEYLELNAISYLLMEEAKLGALEGCKLMDLGGATPGSGLEKFKRSMVKEDGVLPCYVGTKIRNKKIYDELVAISGGPRQGYFPEYRR